jgi:hypothetical protein
MEIKKGQKIFISSTAYDLLDVRAELKHIIPIWGFDILAHENSVFPKHMGLHSHDVCLEAVAECDIFLLIIGGRYGNLYRGVNTDYSNNKKWSVTRCEADKAFKSNKGFITFVRDNVWNERKSYNEFLRKGNSSNIFPPAHVDNIEIFEFLNDINRRDKDNWIVSFNNSVELKEHLKGWLTGETSDIFSAAHFRIYDTNY